MGGQQSAAADAPFRVGPRRDPLISLMPGKIPPESCQPPPEPPTIRRGSPGPRRPCFLGLSGPVRLRVWPVARIKSAISEASRLVETASASPWECR